MRENEGKNIVYLTMSLPVYVGLCACMTVGQPCMVVCVCVCPSLSVCSSQWQVDQIEVFSSQTCCWDMR